MLGGYVSCCAGVGGEDEGNAVPARLAGRGVLKPAAEGGDRKLVAVEALGRRLGDEVGLAGWRRRGGELLAGSCRSGKGREAKEEEDTLPSTTPSMLGMSLFRERADVVGCVWQLRRS